MNAIDRTEAIRNNYTAIKECAVGGEDELHYTVWLKVNQQSFCVTPQAYETMEEAEWFRDQLVSALLTMLEEAPLAQKTSV